MSLQVLILAAGQGKRMRSQLPKVLHHLAGKPLLQHIIHTVLPLSPHVKPIVVYGHQGELLQQKIGDQVKWVKQDQQLGTAHALLQALPLIQNDDNVLILYGDVPLISIKTLKMLINNTPEQALGMLTAQLAQPYGYGRIIRNEAHQVIRIVEEKDADKNQLMITEINPGIYFAPAYYLKKWLPQLSNLNAQQEYYLTDIIALAVLDQIPIYTVMPEAIEEILGVNDKVQLSQLERYYQRQAAKNLMEQGVTLCDPNRFDIRGEIEVGEDILIDINVILEGKVKIGHRCIIGPHTILRNVTLGDDVQIKANCVIENASIASHCIIGPYARIRPGTILAESVHIGNFVEIKQSVINAESKINHLSYIGDSQLGKKVNIGAGTITCNYDGIHKHRTIIGDHAFIGSNTQLVAPVKIGEGATIGAGSTITKDAPAYQLTLSRTPQITIKNWKKPDSNNE